MDIAAFELVAVVVDSRVAAAAAAAEGCIVVVVVVECIALVVVDDSSSVVLVVFAVVESNDDAGSDEYDLCLYFVDKTFVVAAVECSAGCSSFPCDVALDLTFFRSK